MASTGPYPSANSTNEVATSVTSLANFIPEIWEDETIAEYKANLVLRNNVRVMNHRGQKGDTIHIPTPNRAAANQKVEHDAVALIYEAETKVQISIDQHYHYAKLIEDIGAVQALNAQRRFYTDDMAYSLAKRVDASIGDQAKEFGKSTYDYDGAVIGSDGSTSWSTATSGNGASLTDAGIRRAIRTLDDNDVPNSERSLSIPPIEKESLLGIARFTEQAFVGEAGAANAIRNGMFGQLYGVSVFVTTNLPGASGIDAYDNPVQSADSTQYIACILMHRSAIVLVEQVGIRVQSQYKLEHLGDLLVADCLWGVKAVRSGYTATASTNVAAEQAGVALIVPST